ncbi:MAG: PAS domain-containing sensor histidine kinase [archaeon]|nr:PAS domain-containing sensor histidine kinase [archaeon]
MKEEGSSRHSISKVQELRTRLEEAEETLDAIRRGEVDGLIVSTPSGEQVYSISGADKPYRALIAEMSEGAVMLSDDDIVLYCNNGFSKMLRRPTETIVGVNIESLVFSTHVKALKELLSSGREGKGAIAKEITLQTRDGILVPTLVSVNTLESDGRTNTFLVVTDLTAHMEEAVKDYTRKLELAQIALSESEQRLKFHAENIPLAVIEWDRNFVVTRWAGGAEKMFGWTAADTIGKQIMDLHIIYESDIPIFEKTMELLAGGKTKNVSSYHSVMKDGKVIFCKWYNSVLLDRDGKIVSVFSFVEDYTARVEAEKALEESNRNLEKLVEDRTKNLELSLENEIRVSRQALLLQDILTHDIPNYNSVSRMSAEMLKEEVSANGPAEMQKLVDILLQGIDGSTMLIERTKKLGIAFAEKSPKLVPVNVLQKVDDAAKLVSNAFKGNQKRIHFKVRIPDQLNSDPLVLADDMLLDVFDNLYSNSTKYTEGPDVEIETVLEEEKGTGDYWKVSVIDHGRGIEDKSRIFLRYFSKSTKGSGLGMSIVYALVVERYGGRMQARDRIEGDYTKGTVVEILLPRAR